MGQVNKSFFYSKVRLDVIKFIYKKKKSNKELRKFLFFNRVGMQVAISLLLASFRKKLLKMRASRKEP